MVHTQSLTFSYPNSKEIQLPDLQCSAGEAVLVLGASGSGKTTYLQLLAGLRKLQSGSISISGQDLGSMEGKDLDKFRGKNIGLVFQQSHFIPSVTVYENLVLSRSLAKLPPDKNLIENYLKQLNIDHKSDTYPKHLSVGEQQRLSIVLALVNQPRVILADEPTSALDDENANQVIELLKKEANRLSSALIIVTHDQRMKNHFTNQVWL